MNFQLPITVQIRLAGLHLCTIGLWLLRRLGTVDASAQATMLDTIRKQYRSLYYQNPLTREISTLAVSPDADWFVPGDSTAEAYATVETSASRDSQRVLAMVINEYLRDAHPGEPLTENCDLIVSRIRVLADLVVRLDTSGKLALLVHTICRSAYIKLVVDTSLPADERQCGNLDPSRIVGCAMAFIDEFLGLPFGHLSSMVEAAWLLNEYISSLTQALDCLVDGSPAVPLASSSLLAAHVTSVFGRELFGMIDRLRHTFPHFLWHISSFLGITYGLHEACYRSLGDADSRRDMWQLAAREDAFWCRQEVGAPPAENTLRGGAFVDPLWNRLFIQSEITSLAVVNDEVFHGSIEMSGVERECARRSQWKAIEVIRGVLSNVRRSDDRDLDDLNVAAADLCHTRAGCVASSGTTGLSLCRTIRIVRDAVGRSEGINFLEHASYAEIHRGALADLSHIARIVAVFDTLFYAQHMTDRATDEYVQFGSFHRPERFGVRVATEAPNVSSGFRGYSWQTVSQVPVVPPEPSMPEKKIEGLPVVTDLPNPVNGDLARRWLARWWISRHAAQAQNDEASEHYPESWQYVMDHLTPDERRIVRKAGWPRFACKLHDRIGCPECRCPRCGAGGGCSCNARTLRDYTDGPPLPMAPRTVRKVGLELEFITSNHVVLQELLARYPWCHYDGSLGDLGAECKFVTYADRLHHISKPLALITEDRRVKVDRRCGYHVHVERATLEDYSALVHKWRGDESRLFNLFPFRRGNHFCSPLNDGASPDDHHSVWSRSRSKPTWEFRLHPGTRSPLLAVCWANWCVGFIQGRPAKLGDAYLAARKAALEVENRRGYPWSWRRAIEDYARAHGFYKALHAVAAGEFAEYQDSAGLRAKLSRTPMQNINDIEEVME